MNGWDWGPYLVEGGTRPDAMNIDPAFNSALASLFMAAPEDIRSGLRIGSGYRSNERQQQLWDAAVAKYGDPEVADNWVARPGASNHNHGQAVDLKYLAPAAQEWVHANAGNFGLNFPMSHEPWHVEMDGAKPHGAPLSFGAGVPQADTSLAGMFSLDPSAFALGQPEAPETSRMALASALKQKQRSDEETSRRTALADLIRF
jgi:hypothetical protein